MTTSTLRGVLLLAFAFGVAACDGRSPSGPTSLPPVAPDAPGAPSVTAISPSTGSTARPTPVTITGTGFLAGATVTVDAAAMNVTVVNSTMITAMVPAHAAGLADVVVTNPGGPGGTLPAAFTYSLDGPFTLTPSTDVIDAGGQMSVSWTAPGGRAGDWIAVFRVGASSLPRLAAVVPRQGDIVAASPRSLRSGGGGHIHRFTRSGNPERARLSGGGSLSARRICYFTLSVAVNPLSVSRYSQVPMADGTKRKRVSGFTVPLSNAIPPSGIEVDVTV